MHISQVQQELNQARDKGAVRELKIPPCPELLQRLRGALQRGEPDLQEVQAVAAADVAMGATLLRVANSPVHLSDGAPCMNVGQAMTRLGLQPTVSLMTQFLVRHAIPVNSSQLQRFWERSAKRSLCMSFLARHVPGLDPALAESHGLFCHVGLPVLLQQVRGYGSTMVEAAARIDRPYVVTEDANHRTNHAVVGALVVRTWGLPQPLVASVRLHHDFTALTDSQLEPEVALLVAAGLVAEHLMRLHENLPDDAEWALHAEAAMAHLQFTETELAEWSDDLQPQLDYVY